MLPAVPIVEPALVLPSELLPSVELPSEDEPSDDDPGDELPAPTPRGVERIMPDEAGAVDESDGGFGERPAKPPDGVVDRPAKLPPVEVDGELSVLPVVGAVENDEVAPVELLPILPLLPALLLIPVPTPLVEPALTPVEPAGIVDSAPERVTHGEPVPVV